MFLCLILSCLSQSIKHCFQYFPLEAICLEFISSLVWHYSFRFWIFALIFYFQEFLHFFFLDPLWHSILTSFICCFLRVCNVKDTSWKVFFLCAALWTVWASSKDLWVYQPWQKEEWKCQSLSSCVWPFATPWTVAHRAPLSMEFSRQEYWSG